jgi:hypothetical protein
LSAVTLTNLPTEDMEGEFRWIKPALAATRFYSNGFARSAALSGSRYVAPGTNNVLHLTEGLLTFSGGNLEVPFTNHITLGPGNKIASTELNKVTMTFALPTGQVSGTAAVPGASKVLSYRGVVHQKQQRASGFFLGTDQGGRMALEP